jgi:hypothetical protein
MKELNPSQLAIQFSNDEDLGREIRKYVFNSHEKTTILAKLSLDFPNDFDLGQKIRTLFAN